jgi:alkylated DNA nucleotide flippase Atl1
MRGCARPDVPCHRVIAAGGRLGGYGGREVLKRALLLAEGIALVGARVPLQKYRLTSSTARPGRKNARRV